MNQTLSAWLAISSGLTLFGGWLATVLYWRGEVRLLGLDHTAALIAVKTVLVLALVALVVFAALWLSAPPDWQSAP